MNERKIKEFIEENTKNIELLEKRNQNFYE